MAIRACAQVKAAGWLPAPDRKHNL